MGDISNSSSIGIVGTSNKNMAGNIASTSNSRNGIGWDALRDVYFIGPCPHNWLFQHVHAVVHHGGAGE